jgi:N-methylhydantoinase A
VREITIRRGYDPREFPMVVAGGAGPNHACAIASELELPMFLVPRESSIFCAAGMLMTDLKHDVVKSRVARLADLPPETLAAEVEKLSARGREILRAENVPDDRIRITVMAEMRYVRQYHEVSLPLLPIETLPARFHAEHHRLYGYSLEEEGTEMELINLRARAAGITDKPAFAAEESAGPDPSASKKGERRVFLPAEGDFREVPVYDGHLLKAGNRISGPAIVEQKNTTLFAASAFDALVDSMGSLVVYRRGREAALPDSVREALS